jgi:hypothetical protein
MASSPGLLRRQSAWLNVNFGREPATGAGRAGVIRPAGDYWPGGAQGMEAVAGPT